MVQLHTKEIPEEGGDRMAYSLFSRHKIGIVYSTQRIEAHSHSQTTVTLPLD